MNPMKLTVLIVALLGLALAQGEAAAGLSLEQVLARPPLALNLQLAQANLTSAQSVLSQFQSDPTTLKADVVGAEGNLAFALASLTQAGLQARFGLTQAYFNAVNAERQRQVDEARLGQAQTELRVAQERVRLGSGGVLAVEQAQAATTQAQQDVKSDNVLAGVQREILGNLLGLKTVPTLGDQVPVSGVTPTLEAVRQGALKTANVVRAASAVTLAKLRLEQNQSEFVAAAQRTNAQQVLVSAQLEYQVQVTTAQQTAEGAYIAARNASAKFAAAQATLVAQEAALKTAEAQEKAGTVSKLQVLTLGVGLKQSQFALLQARQNVFLAALGLRLAAPTGA